MRRGLVEVAACAVATLGAGMLYRQFFATPDYLLPLVIASVGGALVAAVAATRRWSFTRSFLLACAGFLLVACYGVFGVTVDYGLPTGETATELLWGVVGGWARMLTVGLPADVRGELLVTPVLLAWTAAFAGATLAVRTRSVLAPVAPPLVSFIVALLFVGNRPGVQLVATATFLGAFGNRGGLRTGHGDRPSSRTGVATAGATAPRSGAAPAFCAVAAGRAGSPAVARRAA